MGNHPITALLKHQQSLTNRLNPLTATCLLLLHRLLLLTHLRLDKPTTEVRRNKLLRQVMDLHPLPKFHHRRLRTRMCRSRPQITCRHRLLLLRPISLLPLLDNILLQLVTVRLLPRDPQLLPTNRISHPTVIYLLLPPQ